MERITQVKQKVYLWSSVDHPVDHPLLTWPLGSPPRLGLDHQVSWCSFPQAPDVISQGDSGETHDECSAGQVEKKKMPRGGEMKQRAIGTTSDQCWRAPRGCDVRSLGSSGPWDHQFRGQRGSAAWAKWPVLSNLDGGKILAWGVWFI